MEVLLFSSKDNCYYKGFLEFYPSTEVLFTITLKE